MFSRRPQRPTPSIFSLGPVRKQDTPNFMSHFRTSDGDFDLIKITGTAQQVMDMYNQVRPFVSPVITRFLKK
ncbi:YppG family protein [Pseudoneobacillus rhizosphaerae]|jgi:hypothetical protein|uniref:Uncharacterized protein n=1 Tax=Pseudoneobacillus rhizosphaerae TaxID=2880968 RepID=A0A9C7LD16_9BACI|nr:YppG family protein [Pseudoneobacillus rhizosphaerae]CAG9610818.1 hypothetical protein NEOCIP111885_04600 [Pseudoneobacillus rhizosphaerae]